MEAEASLFESSEMLAAFLASTPLLEESWKLCRRTNEAAPHGFLANRIGDVIYVAFSGIQPISAYNSGCRNMVPLPLDTSGAAGAGGGLFFSGGVRRDDHDGGKEPVMVHEGFLALFVSVCNSINFKNIIMQTINDCKSIVFTGHSVGGTIASLSTYWLLSYLKTLSSPLSVLCITYGSPMLGNESFSQSILQERWGGNFCHVVAQHDIVPRLLFAPLLQMTRHLDLLLNFWHLSMASPSFSPLAGPLSCENKAELYRVLLHSLESFLKPEGVLQDCERSPFWPFGSYVFCSDKGAICVDNAMATLKLLYLMLLEKPGLPYIVPEDHLRYEDYLLKVKWQFLQIRDYMEDNLPQSSYEAGITLALQSSGVVSQEQVCQGAKDCLKLAKKLGRTRNSNSANLAIGLSKINPLRAQIEWYKAVCDDSEDQLGYYDSFKLRGASKKAFRVNMNRIRLGEFWDRLIVMLEANQLPYDFHKRAKWVNASQFYKLLVEPLDIAEYYRTGMHHKKGHYLEHGRERRYQIFDKWWEDRKRDQDFGTSTRSKFASSTQDSCFWARVEEARDWLRNLRTEREASKRDALVHKISGFDQYARRMVDMKEVSKDVLARNSSYSSFVEEWTEFKSQLQILHHHHHGFVDGKMVP